MSARALTRSSMLGARALTRASILAATAACVSEPRTAGVLNDRERVIGRALLADRVMLLTDAPALIGIDLHTRTSTRAAIARTPGDRKLWGLGQTDGSLYTVAGFTDLVRVTIDGGTRVVARFERPMGNLFDTPEGMAGQVAVDNPATGLAWMIDSSARLTPIHGAVRQALGLSRAEDGVLQLLSCSAPPRVVCWLPGSNQILTLTATRLDAALQLNAVGRVLPARLLARPDTRVIQDALLTDRDTIVALFRPSPEADRTSLAEFGLDGRMLRGIEPEMPLRLLLEARSRALIAITKSGRLIAVPL